MSSSDSASRRTAAEQETQRLWRLAGMGGTMASEIIAGFLLGWGLDLLFGTAPTLLIIGAILGIAVGMTSFIRKARAESRRAAQEATRIATRIDAERRPDGDASGSDAP